MADYTEPIWQVVLGIPQQKQWWSLEFADNHIELFNTVHGRVRRVAELTAQNTLHTVVKHQVIHIPDESLHNTESA